MPQKPSADFEVRRYGTDSSGRPILMTAHMRRRWKKILADPRVKPFAHKLVVVQGAFMAQIGGGADASAGYHDKAGGVDVRSRNLTTAEIDTFIFVASCYGFQFWRRDKTPRHGGMDPHLHGICGGDKPLAPGLARQWDELLAGGDGLVGGGSDYEKRLRPLVTKEPESPMIALLKDLTAVANRHGVTRVYAARVLLWGATPSNTGRRLARIKAARNDLKGMS